MCKNKEDSKSKNHTKFDFEFYTEPYGDGWSYHLISYRKWEQGYTREFQKLIVDCGVNSLIGKHEYPHINNYPLKVKENECYPNF